MKAIFNITNSMLTIVGENIRPVIIFVDEMEEYHSILDLLGNPILDFQLIFDDEIDTDSDLSARYNVMNYILQCIRINNQGEQIGDFRLIDLTLVSNEPFIQILGVKNEFGVNMPFGYQPMIKPTEPIKKVGKKIVKVTITRKYYKTAEVEIEVDRNLPHEEMVEYLTNDEGLDSIFEDALASGSLYDGDGDDSYEYYDTEEEIGGHL